MRRHNRKRRKKQVVKKPEAEVEVLFERRNGKTYEKEGWDATSEWIRRKQRKGNYLPGRTRAVWGHQGDGMEDW